MATTSKHPDRPLAGLRIIELSSFVAAPLCGMTLAQLGADVVRIDPHGGSADIDRWPVASSGASLYWAGLNKGKASVTADFRGDEARDLVHQLLTDGGADGGIVVTNAVGRPWLGYDELSKVRPDLIHLHILGRRDGSAAVDYTVNAGVGFPMVTGPSNLAEPVNHVLPAWDIACGLYGALSIVSAERQRRLTGQGAQLTAALEDIAIAMAGNLGFLAEAELNRDDRPRIGNHLFGGFAKDFRCADGLRVMVAPVTGRQWKGLAEAAGVAEAAAVLENALNADFGTDSDRYRHRELLAALIEPWFAATESGVVGSALDGARVPWSVYQTFRELSDNLAGDELLEELDQPGVGRLRAVKSPVRWGADYLPTAAAPQLGAQTPGSEQGWSGLFGKQD